MTLPTGNFLRLDIGDAHYAIDRASISDVHAADSMREAVSSEGGTSSTPHLDEQISEALVGWLPADGAEFPVFSLKNLFSAPDSIKTNDSASASSQIVIVESRAPGDATVRHWGLLVDGTSDIHVSAARIDDLPVIATNADFDYFQGIAKLAYGLALVLSPEGLNPYGSNGAEQAAAQGSRNGERQSTGLAEDSGATGTGGELTGFEPRTAVIFSVPGSVEDLLVGLSHKQVPEIGKPIPAINVPGAPEFVTGLINWRDRVLPLIDFAARIGMKSDGAGDPIRSGRLLIARAAALNGSDAGRDESSQPKSESAVAIGAFIVNSSIRMLNLPTSPPLTNRKVDLDESYVRGAFDLAGETLLIPDLGRMLTPDD